MTGSCSRYARRGSWIVLTSVTALLLTGSARAADRPQGNNLLDQTRRLAEIAAQKMEADVRSAVLEAQKLAAADPARAVERLKNTLDQLENNDVLPRNRRETLASMLRSRIKSLEAGPVPAAAMLTEQQLQAQLQKSSIKKDQESKNDDDEKLRRNLNTILDLQKQGKAAEARKLADELARQYPSNPAVAASIQTSSAFEQLVSARAIHNEKERRSLNVMRDIERSSIPPAGDVEFPKDWKEKTKRRTSAMVTLTAKEKALLRALDTPVSVTFKQERFQDVVEYLATATGQPFLLDKSSLSDAQIDYDTPVSLSVKNVSVRSVLKKILGDLGLAYVVKDECIQIISAAKAKEMMLVRSYYIGDLLNAGGGPGDPATNIFGPGVGQLQMMQNIAGIIDLIQTTVDPPSWQSNGGPGAIFFHYPTMSLVIKQSAEVHGVLSGGGFLR